MPALDVEPKLGSGWLRSESVAHLIGESVFRPERPELVNGVKESGVGLMLLALRDPCFESVKPFVECSEFGIVSEGDHEAAVGGVDHPQPSTSKLFGIDRTSQLEHDHEMRLDAERPLAVLMTHRQIAGALAKPAAVLTQIIVKPL